jgi:hypothetical protein
MDGTKTTIAILLCCCSILCGGLRSIEPAPFIPISKTRRQGRGRTFRGAIQASNEILDNRFSMW